MIIKHDLLSDSQITMSQKTFFTVSGSIFFLIAIFHLLRAVLGWEVTLGGAVIPLWLSWVGFVVAVSLGYIALKHSKN